MVLQLWDRLKSDAEKAYATAHDLVKQGEEAEAAADAAQADWDNAKQYVC